MLTVYPTPARDGSPALIVFAGPARRSVTWTLAGPGALTPLSSSTDAAGMAAARYTPAGTGSATISVEYGDGT